jgi:hypothetical protein
MILLVECLKELNEWLAEKNLTIHISVIGRFAFYLSGIQQIATLDIDSVTEIEEEVFEKIIEIGKRRGIKPEWLNDNAENLPMPDGFIGRLIESNHHSNLKIKYASRIDLISLKAAAYLGRGLDDPKDFQDLLLLNPSHSEIETAILYIRQYFTPPAAKFFPDFEESLNELRSISKK